jgi:acyl-CoA thioester hydrolase
MLEKKTMSRPFVHHTAVHFDDLDAMSMLHNGRYPVLAERAVTAFFDHLGWQWHPDVAMNPDQFHAVRAVGPVDVAVTVDRLGTTSAAFGFTVQSRAGVHARGRRSVVKLDPASLLPVAWSDAFRDGLSAYVVASAA